MPAELVVVYCLKLIGFYVRKGFYYKNCEGFLLLIMWEKRRVLHTGEQAKRLAGWKANRLSGYRSKINEGTGCKLQMQGIVLLRGGNCYKQQHPGNVTLG